ncbi:TadE/TadG family type IV pilus assembly protein [Bradyrhizobium sp. ARR65]|uniref:TadE/TadG family type IV pilus assembly protein n=1 Tax=Bradyrhizobium sp. ARR65 TaxID=1040989 RepID=UPI00055846DF|nr:TadE/TadG family type IV pilus assembly protein [Bradyrhizobium sp. ARR65]
MSRIRSAFVEFARAEEGNLAVIFAIAILPMLVAVGAAVDYSRASLARTQMQNALDSTALMLARDLASNVITTSQIPTKGPAYFSGLYTNKDAQNVSVTASYTQGSGTTKSTVLVTAKAQIKTDFMQVVGFPLMSFDASSTAVWGFNLLRVALVLDNTGSMNDYNKIGALKTAANNLVTQLSGLAQNNGDVMISVVPFEVEVNIGKSYKSATWLRWDLWDANNTNSWGGTYCSGGSWFTKAECLGHGYTWGDTQSTSDTSLWNGCVSDRDQSYDVSSTVPSSTATNFPADQERYCPVAALLPLTYNWSSVTSTINSMTANGATNQTIGLQWGWLSLLQQAPLNAPAEDPTKVYQHVIVLFTDGLNTADRWYGNGSSTSTQVDTRMKALCDAIKQTNTTIYTVQIDTDGAGQSAVLPYCASSAGNFYMLTNPNQIATAFAAIGTQISQLRVAK